MGAIINLRNEIESIIDEMDLVKYYRASANEANALLMKNKSNHCFAFHVDQTTVTGQVSNPSYVYLSIPTEILFVYKAYKLDDKLKNSDSLVDKAEDIAHEFFYRLSQSSIISDIAEWDDYNIQRLEAYKRFDAILTGVLFTWNTPLIKTQCQ